MRKYNENNEYCTDNFSPEVKMKMNKTALRTHYENTLI
jgi:hypothetical protein